MPAIPPDGEQVFEIENLYPYPPPRSPLMIRLFLACYYSPEPAKEVGPAWNSPAGRRIREWLANHRLIKPDNTLTERGTVWLKAILNTPLPVLVTHQTWTIPYTSGELP